MNARRTLTMLGGIAGLGILLLLGAFAVFLLSSDEGSDLPSLAAAPTLPVTPTPTPLPSLTPEASPTPTPIPTEGPTPTPGPTATPEYMPDDREREIVVPILMYHYISTPPEDADIYRLDLSTPPDVFREHMQWLKDNGYETISLYDLAYRLRMGSPELPEKPVVLTFDDGYVDNYENAYPIMEEFGYTGTFFILTDVTDRSQPGYMTWDMLRDMKEGGHDIEVHGREHLEMNDRDDSWLYYHMIGAAETIEATLGHRPRILSYPAGRYDPLVVEKMAEYEYWVGVTTVNGSLHVSDAPYELKRVRIRGEWSLETYASVVEAASY